MTEVADDEHRAAAQRVRELLSVYREHEDLISIGAYRRGANPSVDLAIEQLGPINDFLRQRVDERSSVAEAREQLMGLCQQAQRQTS
jgi:flagellum-specific ATP synthase